MKPLLKAIAGFSVALVLALGLHYSVGTFDPAPEQTVIEVIKEVPVEVEVVREPEGVIISLTLSDMYADLSNRYSHISVENRNLIMESIAKAADKYNINPLVLYSLIAVESSFRWWIEHPLVTVNGSDNKPTKTRAIGLGGVVFEIWGDKLKEAGVISTKSDLFLIDKNIAASAFIYSYLKSKPLHPKANNPIESGLIRYFGGGYRSYFEKIDAEIASMFRNKLYGGPQ